MKLKKINTFILIGIAVIGLSSCQNNDEPLAISSESTVEKSTPLGEILANIFQSDNSEEEYYVLFNSESQEFMVLSPDEYAFCKAFASLVDNESISSIHKAPSGNGWKYGGKGKGRWEALKLADKIAKQIPANRDFEIHVERGDDGSYSVWYRLV